MSATTAIQNGFGKSPQNAAGEKFPQIGETNIRVINKINEMYDNAAVIFGRWLGVTDKTAKRKLNLERSLSVEELGRLIRSERGYEIVAAIMGDATPEWWRLCSVLMDAADIRKMQIAAQRRAAKVLKGVLDADRDLSEAIQRAETLAFYGSEQAGVQADALREINRVSDRPVAKGRVKP
jgi:hypothetical protein